MAGIIVLAVLALFSLVIIGLVVGGLALNRRHRREDEASSADRINGP